MFKVELTATTLYDLLLIYNIIMFRSYPVRITPPWSELFMVSDKQPDYIFLMMQSPANPWGLGCSIHTNNNFFFLGEILLRNFTFVLKSGNTEPLQWKMHIRIGTLQPFFLFTAQNLCICSQFPWCDVFFLSFIDLFFHLFLFLYYFFPLPLPFFCKCTCFMDFIPFTRS